MKHPSSRPQSITQDIINTSSAIAPTSPYSVRQTFASPLSNVGGLSSLVHWGSSPINSCSTQQTSQWAAAPSSSSSRSKQTSPSIRGARSIRRVASTPTNSFNNKRLSSASPTRLSHKKSKAPNVTHSFATCHKSKNVSLEPPLKRSKSNPSIVNQSINYPENSETYQLSLAQLSKNNYTNSLKHQIPLVELTSIPESRHIPCTHTELDPNLTLNHTPYSQKRNHHFSDSGDDDVDFWEAASSVLANIETNFLYDDSAELRFDITNSLNSHHTGPCKRLPVNTPSPESGISVPHKASTRPFPANKLRVRRFSVLYAAFKSLSCAKSELHISAIPDPLFGTILVDSNRPTPPRPFLLILRDQWAKLNVSPGAIIHVVCTPFNSSQDDTFANCSLLETRTNHEDPWADLDAYFDRAASAHTCHGLSKNQNNTFTIDANHHFVIVHPDVLLSGTTVAEGYQCVRRAVIKDRVRSSGVNRPSVLGKLAHSVVQDMLVCVKGLNPTVESLNVFIEDTNLMNTLIQSAIKRSAIDLAAVKMSSDEAQKWIQDLCHRTLTEFIIPATDQSLDCKTPVKINQVLDIEEDIWAPKFGLKGKLDGTILATIPNDMIKSVRNESNSEPSMCKLERQTSGILALEIKTGKPQPAVHRAQTMMYALMLHEAYAPSNIVQVGGCLFNTGSNSQAIGLGSDSNSFQTSTQSSSTEVVALRHDELRDLILARNQIAAGLQSSTSPYPGVLGPSNASACSRCYVRPQCALLHASVERGKRNVSVSFISSNNNLVGHLTKHHLNFLRDWLRLIDLENEVESKKPIWTDDLLPAAQEKAQSRSKAGSLRNLTFVKCIASRDPTHPFDKPTMRATFTLPNSDCDCYDIVAGDVVTLSREGGPYGLARCFFKFMNSNECEFEMDRPFRVQSGLISSDRFRADKLEPVGFTSSTMRANLINLFLPIESKLRDLVVDLKLPRTVPNCSSSWTDDQLNDLQQHAIDQCAYEDQDYTLLVGYPGTGKSTTLAYLLKRLAKQGNKVLLSSHTHSAVDTVLLKLQPLGVPFVRLGAIDRIHPELRHATLIGKTPEEISQQFIDARVVAVTCLGASHPLLHSGGGSNFDPESKNHSEMHTKQLHGPSMMFDVCIVDEASQISLPIVLSPLALARRFILVGDCHQLSPIVRSSEYVSQNNMSESLFERLLKEHPKSAVYLSVQYRMNKEIMDFVNRVIYNGRLVCGNATVANRRLIVPNPAAIRNTPNWIQQCMTSPSVVFLDVPWAKETVLEIPQSRADDVTSSSKNPINKVQVDMVLQLVTVLTSAGIEDTDIGIITPYRNQRTKIRTALDAVCSTDPEFGRRERGTPSNMKQSLRNFKMVECSTIDQYQGRDKLVIIVSLVRCNVECQIGELLRDWKRINVAITRARSKLILIGCSNTLTKLSMFWKELILDGRDCKIINVSSY